MRPVGRLRVGRVMALMRQAVRRRADQTPVPVPPGSWMIRSRMDQAIRDRDPAVQADSALADLAGPVAR